MKRLLFAFTLLSSFALSAKEPVTEPEDSLLKQSNFYASIGVGPLPLLVPVFGIGHREHWNHQGFDVSVQAATIVKTTALRANLLYSYLFDPNPKGQTYLNLGAALASVFHHGFAGLVAAPEVAVGRSWSNASNEKRFCQAEITFPNFPWKFHHSEKHFKRHDILYFPVVSVSYGFLF